MIKTSFKAFIPLNKDKIIYSEVKALRNMAKSDTRPCKLRSKVTREWLKTV